MSTPAVELRNITKVFTSGRTAEGEQVFAVKDANLSISPGEFFTLLGPSGCGKTTTLRLIAGFESPSKGEVCIQGQPMAAIPPNLRPVNTVFQNYALFPHMTVAKNVAFGLAIKRVAAQEQERRVKEALALVQLADMGKRRPSQLSGGQQQRVALARALVNQPAVLLLDEPLGALDLKLRKAMQIELKQLQKQVGITFVYVTHDQEEALTMSDRIAVMNAGVILQVGDPVTLYERPATRFVADFIGESNFFTAAVVALEDGRARMKIGQESVTASLGDQRPPVGDPVTFTVRPEKMRIDPIQQGPVEALSGIVHEVVYIGTDTRYMIALDSGEEVVVRVQIGCAADLDRFKNGDRVKVYWNPEDARILSD